MSRSRAVVSRRSRIAVCRDRGSWCRGDRGSRCVTLEDRGVSRSRIAVCHASRIEDRCVPRCRDRGSRCREQLQATEILSSTAFHIREVFQRKCIYESSASGGPFGMDTQKPKQTLLLTFLPLFSDTSLWFSRSILFPTRTILTLSTAFCGEQSTR